MEYITLAINSYTAGNDTELVAGEDGKTKLLKDLFFTNTTSSNIDVTIKYNSIVAAYMTIAGNSTVELSSILSLTGSANKYYFNASATGLNIVGTVVVM